MTNILNIKAYPTIQNIGNTLIWVITYQADYYSSQSGQSAALNGLGTTNTGTTPYRTYSDFLTAVTALQNTADINNPAITDICGNILSLTNGDAVTQGAVGTLFSGYQIEIIDEPVETQIQRDIAAALAALVPNVRTTSALSLSLVSTGATGTQISSTKDSTVKTTVATSATATIAGGAVSAVALKICATNSATEGNWTTVATQETDQTVSLALTLQSVTAQKGQLCADVPAGWYAKLVNSGSGTHAESFVSGQQTIYG